MDACGREGGEFLVFDFFGDGFGVLGGIIGKNETGRKG